MAQVMESLASLVDSYKDLDIRDEDGNLDYDRIRTDLQAHAWTPEGAAELVHLVQEFGFFVLRNAAALAIALNVQDGDRGM